MTGPDARDPVREPDEPLVRDLIADQFPRWGGLAVCAVADGGWDNRTFRLGDEMLVRLPSAERYAGQVRKEQHWLPRLRGSLPLDIPEPVALGRPGCGYPWHWSVYRWIEGATAVAGPIASRPAFAATLAGFLAALHRIDTTDGPPAGVHNFQRGGSLAHYDDEARRAIASLRRVIDHDRAGALWTRALASAWTEPPVWVHGDVSAGNLLVRDGRLAAVIDFGCLGVGDPACDLVIAWTFLDADSRRTFRAALPFDDDTWDRARGWALWKAAITLAEGDRADGLDAVEAGRRVIDALMAGDDGA